MEYYIAKSGEKVGPLTQFRLVEMLRDGEISEETNVWHKDLDSWRPLGEEPSLASKAKAIQDQELRRVTLENEAATADPSTDSNIATADQQPELVAQKVRPLTRFFARQFDYFLVGVGVQLFSGFKLSEETTNQIVNLDKPTSIEALMTVMENKDFQQLAMIMFIAILVWHIVEGILLNLFGTTPGKALFGIQVSKADGDRPSILDGIYRSFLVYILGVGLLSFPLFLVAMVFSFFRLMSKGATPWDQWLRLDVKHPPLSFARILLAVFIFLALLMLPHLNFA